MKLKTFLDLQPRGYASQLAQRLNISKSYLSQMAAETAPISPTRAVQIEAESGGAVTRADCRAGDWKAIWPDFVAPMHGNPSITATVRP